MTSFILGREYLKIPYGNGHLDTACSEENASE